MKNRVFLSVLMIVFVAMKAQSQTNPQRGSIITNHHETLKGYIDYLSDEKNAYECHFKADGESSYKLYKPGEIAEYKLDNGGAYYVSRTFPVGNQQKTVFASYLLKGEISLFHLVEGNTDYYYFVDANGRVAVMKDENKSYRSAEEAMKVRRDNVREVSQLFSKRTATVNKLSNLDLSPRSLTRITREYVENYCTSNEDCVQYLVDEKSASTVKAKMRIAVGGGLGSFKVKPLSGIKADDLSLSGFVPEFGAGIDLHFPRMSRYLFFQGMVLASLWDMSKDSYNVKFTNVDVQLGAALRSNGDQVVSPLFRAGVILGQTAGMKTTDMGDYINGHGTTKGLYIGAGVDIPIGKPMLAITADLQYRHDNKADANLLQVGLNASVSF